MTAPEQEPDAVHYVGILEAVVATLAIKCGLNPQTMMARAIEDITEQTGMETAETERIIRSRWSGRQLSAAAFVSTQLPVQLAPVAPVAQETPVAPPMSDRLQAYKERQAEGQPDTDAAEP